MADYDISQLSAQEIEALKSAQAEAGADAPTLASDDTVVGKRIMLLPLLNEHSGLIEALRTACQAELNSDPDPAMLTHYNDNVFLLRFLLSAKLKLEKAIHAVKTTIAWRNKHREMLARMRAGEPVPGMAEVAYYNIADEHKTTYDGAPVLIVRSGISDITAAVKNVAREHIFNSLVFSKELAYVRCDQLSRQKGYLVKTVTIIDMAHDSVTRAMDRDWMKIMGDSMKESELCYPQLLGATVLMNTPGWFKIVFGVASKFMPQSSVEKMVICKHKVHTYDAKRKGVDIVKNPYAWARFVPPENIPTFLGGTCMCDRSEKYPNGRCICRIDNDRTIPVTSKPLPPRD